MRDIQIPNHAPKRSREQIFIMHKKHFIAAQTFQGRKQPLILLLKIPIKAHCQKSIMKNHRIERIL